MTEREKNPPPKGRWWHPGLGYMIGGMFALLMSWMYLSHSEGFIKGLRTYFWASGEGTVLMSELRYHTNAGEGTVRYMIEAGGDRIEETTDVFEKRMNWDLAEFEEWASQYKPGSSVLVYYNEDGESSLGRWPSSYSYGFGAQGICTLVSGLLFMQQGLRKRKLFRREADV